MVSGQGEDEPKCLTASPTTPCKTLSYVITEGATVVCMEGIFQNMSEDLNMTNIEGGKQENEITIVCIACVLIDSNVTFYGSSGYIGIMHLFGFTMRNVQIQLRNMNVTFQHAVLEQAIIQDFESSSNQVHFQRSRLSCFDSRTCGLSLRNSSIAKCVIIQSNVTNFKLNFDTMDLMLIINDTVMLVPGIHVSVHSFPYLKVPSFIYLHNVTFDTHTAPIDNSSSPFKVGRPAETLSIKSEIVLHLINPLIQIHKCNFYQTHFEIAATRQEFDLAYFLVMISNTTFSNSHHDGNGGALMINSEVLDSRLIISSCIFINNSAAKGFSESKGNGGGISIISDSLDAQFESCLFINNVANDIGLALYTSEGITVSIINCSFHYTVDPRNPIQNEIMFIAGKATQIQGNFQVTNFQPDSYVGPISIFYIANGEKLNIGNTCPDWYRHDVQYALASSYNDIAADIGYTCNPCSDNYYTTSPNHNVLSFSPNGNTSGLITESANNTGSVCNNCPYGAICTGNNVMPRPNYWGYWHEGELVFQQCPAGYCCPSSGNSNCNMYDYCEGNRTGTLCGACQKGFSVSILTGSCTPDSQCGGDQWFWLVVFSATMAYALWYTLKDDIFALLFMSIRIVKDIFKRSNARTNDVTLSNMNTNKEGSAGPSFDDIEEIDDNDEASAAGNDGKISGDPSTPDDADKRYFGIVTYYVQMAAVIKIQIEFSDIDESEPLLDRIVNNIARFLNLELTQMTFDVCPIVGLTTIGKHLYNLFFLLGIYVSWAGVFTVAIIIVTIVHKVGRLQSLARRFDSFKMLSLG